MKNRIFTLFFLFLCIYNTQSQVIIKITDVPRYYTALRDTIFFTGNLNSWQTDDPAYMMVQQSDGTYILNITSTVGALVEFKFTRGSWTNVETQVDGSFLPNRSFNYVNGDTVECSIANWEDMLGWHTSVGNTYILDLDFWMPQLNRNRRIWLYLPQDYFTSNNYYPAVYMHDGQNLFDAVYAPFGEWNVDSTMESLFGQFSPTAIIVGIDNGAIERINEYSPWYNTTHGGGVGELYAEFIVNTLKPYIDSHFRTMPNRENTAVAGSSMGGLISMYAALAYPSVFSKAGIFSPSFWFSDSLLTYINTVNYTQAQRFYFVAGQNESTAMVSDIQDVSNALIQQGFASSQLNTVIRTDGEHSEWFWKREFADAYTWLFQVVTGSSDELPKADIIYYPNRKELILFTSEKLFSIKIFDLQGRILSEHSKEVISVSNLKSGIYILDYKSGSYNFSKKIFIY